jgi:hypothetical protein
MKQALLTSKTAKRNQRGMASIVIVAVLVVILTLVSIGFGRLMNRAITTSTDKELSAAASYAAQSGVSDAIKYIQAHYKPADPDGTIKNTSCTSLIGSGGALHAQADLSGDSNIRYTCLTINPDITDLVFGGTTPLPPNKSQIIKMTTGGGTSLSNGSLMFSWSDSSGHVGTDPSNKFYDETTWSTKNLAPVLRLTLYPLASSATAIDNVALQAASRTYFLYPNSGGTNISGISWNTISPLHGVNCSSPGKPGANTVQDVVSGATSTFNTGSDNPSDYTCSAVITSLPNIGASSLFYARVTPIYDSTNLRVQGNDGSNLVQFQGVQAIVDSTAKASTSSKRLQARVDLGGANGTISDNVAPGDDNLPEYAVGSANTICKRLDVNSLSVSVDSTATYCAGELTIIQPVLGLALCATVSGNICTPTSTGLPNATISNGGAATIFYSVTNSTPGSCSLSPGGPSGFGDTSSSWTTGALSSAGSSIYTLTCNNVSGVSSSLTVNVTVSPPGGGVGGVVSPSTLNPYIIGASTSGFTWGLNTQDNGDGDGAAQCDLLDNGSHVTMLFGYSGSGPGTLTRPAAFYGGSFASGHTITISCKPVDGGPNPVNASAVVGAPQITVSPEVVGGYWYTGSLGSATCHDGVHAYILCFSWNASQPNGGAGGIIGPCQIWGNSGSYGNFGPTTYYSSTVDSSVSPWVYHYWNETLGWSGDPGTVNVYITCTSTTYGNTSSPPSGFQWSGFCVSSTGTGCTSNIVPPPPPPPPGGGGGPPPPPPPPPPPNCPAGWSGTFPTCVPPPPPGGCGIDTNRPYYPSFGIMFYFGYLPPCL